MPSATANIIQTQTFNHKGVTYVVCAFTEPHSPHTVNIDVTNKGIPVAITYPDGLQATLTYTVDLITRIDLQRQMGLSAVDELMKTAEQDIRNLI